MVVGEVVEEGFKGGFGDGFVKLFGMLLKRMFSEVLGESFWGGFC